MVEQSSQQNTQNNSRPFLTLPNSPNWDSEAPASFLDKIVAYCANSSVHCLELTDEGFIFKQTIGFAAKFKKQFCRCVTVLILPSTSLSQSSKEKNLLVSLDKRTIVWEKIGSEDRYNNQNNNRNNQLVKSVSVGDIVVRMEALNSTSISQEQLITRVIALSQKGHVYRLGLSEQSGLTVEQIYAQDQQISINISASYIRSFTSEDNRGQFQVIYGTDCGQVGIIFDQKTRTSVEGEFQQYTSIKHKVVGKMKQANSSSSNNNAVKISSVIALENGGQILATGKDGTLMVATMTEDNDQEVSTTVCHTFSIPSATPTLQIEEVKKQENKEVKQSVASAAPKKTLESFKLLALSDQIITKALGEEPPQILLSGKDGMLHTFNMASCLASTSQMEFEKGFRLVSDSGHNMPILQLLSDRSRAALSSDLDADEDVTFVSLGYDRAIIAWQTLDVKQQCCYIDQLTKVSCLGQTIDKEMLANLSANELIVVQNRPSSQKVLSIELDLYQKCLLTSDLTSTKILDRSAPITTFTIGQEGKIALVHAESRLSVYDTLQKELLKKYRCPAGGKIKNIAFSTTISSQGGESQEVILMLVSTRKDTVIELQELNLLTGKLSSEIWQGKSSIEAAKIWLMSSLTIVLSLQYKNTKNNQSNTVLIQSGKKSQTYEGYETLSICSKGKFVCLNTQTQVMILVDAQTGDIILEKRVLNMNLTPFLTSFLPSTDQIVIVPKDATNELLFLDILDLNIVKKAKMDSLIEKASSIFSTKITSMVVNNGSEDSMIVIACEDKCLRAIPLQQILAVATDVLPGNNNNSIQRKKKNVKNNQEATKKQRTAAQSSSNPTEGPPQLVTEKTLFSIVRSRVFYQQRAVDTQKIIAEITNASSHHSYAQFAPQKLDAQSQEEGELKEEEAVQQTSIDFKLLLFHPSADQNKSDAINVIKAELQTCVFIERFEYFQKLVILNLWLCSLSLGGNNEVNKVVELIQMHRANIRLSLNDELLRCDFDLYIQQLEMFLIKDDENHHVTIVNPEKEKNFIHVQQAQKILSVTNDAMVDHKQAALNLYLEKGCLIEALVLTKMWNDRAKFLSVLNQHVLPQLRKENKVQQIAKVSKALEWAAASSTSASGAGAETNSAQQPLQLNTKINDDTVVQQQSSTN